MKTPTILFLVILCCPALLEAQCETYGFSFLTQNNDTHYRGLAETGVTTSGNGQVFLPWQENPALLGTAQSVFAVKGDLYRKSSVSNVFKPTAINVNTQSPLSERSTLGIDAKVYSIGRVPVRAYTFNATDTIRPIEYVITGSLGFKLNDHFSLGGGFSFLRSNLLRGTLTQGNRDLGPIQSFALHFGAHYRGQNEVSTLSRLTYEVGLSITNIGPKVQYSRVSKIADFIPATLQLGGRLGWEGDINGEQSFGVNLITQIDHLLVPVCDNEDLNNNGIADFQDKGVLQGAFSSFGDHRDGFGGEVKGWIKRVAFHPWVDLNAEWKLGAGVGFIYYTTNDATNFNTLGMNLAYRNFQLEVSNIGRPQTGDIQDFVWSIALGYHGSLREG